MESSGGVGKPEISLDISFGFDNPKYSDRTLLLEIVDSDDDPSHLVRNVKRRRLDDDDLLINATTAPRVKTVHINSLILAARSTFFRKLFSNGMLESEQKNATLRINTSEEASLMDLLKYVYSNNLPTSLNGLLDLLVRADKFEVASCLRDCTRSLQNLPMTYESASIYLDLPPSLLMSPIVEPLAVAAKQFLIANFKDLDKFKEEMLNLPLVGIQAVLSSDDLRVTSEGVVYDFVLRWVHKHYSDLEERREILKIHLLHLVRFPFMTTKKLTEEVQTCDDIDPEVASKIVTRTLVFKAAETLHQKHCLAVEEGNTASQQYVERAYKCRPVKVVELEVPHQQCIVYFHLTREEVAAEVVSQSFHLGRQPLRLGAVSSSGNQTDRRYFNLGLKAFDSANFTVKYEIALRKKPTEVFGSFATGTHTITETEKYAWLICTPWTGFIEDDSPYFINNVLYLRVDLTLKS
ncbi:hypothetical protein ACS0TY_004162 [Phlomoides rotata]